MTGSRTLYRGTIEYLDVPITATVDLTDQPVYISLDNRETYVAATWGDPSVESVDKYGRTVYTRYAIVLFGEDNPLPTSNNVPVFVKVTDDPEVPVVRAGSLTLA